MSFCGCYIIISTWLVLQVPPPTAPPQPPPLNTAILATAKLQHRVLVNKRTRRSVCMSQCNAIYQMLLNAPLHVKLNRLPIGSVHCVTTNFSLFTAQRFLL